MAILHSFVTGIATLTGLAVLFTLCHAIYNLFLHPLSRFPGPRLAAVTRLYEYYYAFLLDGGGRLSDHLLELHQIYGPIVRINPFEVHILDRDMYDQIFNFSSELDKRVYYGSSNLQNSPAFATHRMRRKVFNPLFSKASIARIEPLIGSTVEKLCDRLREARESGNVVNLSVFFRCATFDIVCDYALAKGFGLLDNPSTHDEFLRGFLSIFKVLGLIQQAPLMAWAIMLLRSLPRWVQNSSSRNGLAYVKVWQNDLGPKVRSLVGKASEKDEENTHPVVIEEYLRNPTLPSSEKSEARLRDNVLMLVAAGMETTGYALSMATFQLLSNRRFQQQLRAELDGVWSPDDSLPSWHTLERLPYLTAVIKESLRMSIGVMSHLHRVNHHRPMEYKEWTIPPGTSVSMSQRFILYDPEIFPEPNDFRPDRWMDGEHSQECDRWLVAFSRGARNCIGSHLAWAELYITLAVVFHRFDFQLHDTDESHILPTRDFFIPMPECEDGLRVVVESERID